MTPIFYDASGRRVRWARALIALAVILFLVGNVLFAATLIGDEGLGALLPAGMQRNLHALEAAVIHPSGHDAGRWLPRTPASTAAAPPRQGPVRAAFYVPWDPASRVSLQAHIDAIDWLVPATLTLTPQGQLQPVADPDLVRIVGGAEHRPLLLPMVQNASGDHWDGAGTARLLADPAARARLITALVAQVQAQQGNGVAFDLEDLPPASLPAYRSLLSETRAAFAPHHWLVTLAVPAADDDWDLGAFAQVADKLFLMSYDEHALRGDAGPIASQAWFAGVVQNALAHVPADKLIIGIGSYAYDWHAGTVDDLSNEEAWLAAHDSDTTPSFDPAIGNAHFSYEEDGGERHDVWMLDAASAWNELQAARTAGAAGVALWRLGSEDPGLWPAFANPSATAPPVAAMQAVTPESDVDVEGNGELLHIDATPQEGQRALTTDASGMIRGETWSSMPTPYVVRRGGDHPGTVALTFDDGPDAEWTPQILDVLEHENVPATFFVIGENAVGQGDLLRRIVADGGEIGNHSYTHPNLAELSPGQTALELRATQRLVEAYTGRSTRLFRAPYFGDAEPTTADELGPAFAAQQAGYLNVGLHVDPDDWMQPGSDVIVQRVVDAVTHGDFDHPQQIVLLHDGGGDRSQTLAALPEVIHQLKARGYHFATVSQLAGATRDEAMPPVPVEQQNAVAADAVAFGGLATAQSVLGWLFAGAIGLGLLRALVLTALALRDRRVRPAPPEVVTGKFVSVLIPAYNEARVIEASVRRVLASEDVALEVIVIDDGSADETSAIVQAAFGADRRVQLLTLPNGGKARALNRGLALAKGGIVVALDADTQFEPQTIARLARWFDDEAIGAVAGNAKVGNRINLVTKWQAVEYVTAQNLERRALDRLGAVTVVPGAVGAWRRAALDAVGGYPPDTLAEDQDLTIAVQRAGWRIAYDVDAVAWTEAPESFRALSKQRFRWAFGTLQCLWKHGSVIRTGKPRGLARIGLPQAWLFQIAFALISPVIDLALVASLIGTALRVIAHGWAQTGGDLLKIGTYWLVFMAVDALCGWIAYRLEPREKGYPILLLLAQRFVYRQIMYAVVVRAVWSAIRGGLVGWGKLDRTGSVATAGV